MLLVITAVAVVALVLSCVAIAISIITKSDVNNREEIKRLDEHEKRFQAMEQELKTQGKDDTPKISEIKPADVFQISTYVTGNSYVAELAIDGDVDSHMHTNKETNPWWVADMGGIYHVKIVIVTNINKGQGHSEAVVNRATNLRVGVASTRPVVGENRALDAYTLCEQKPGHMGLVGIVNCPDGVTGQYLVVQFKTVNYMHIAEVKIYGFGNQL